MLLTGVMKALGHRQLVYLSFGLVLLSPGKGLCGSQGLHNSLVPIYSLWDWEEAGCIFHFNAVLLEHQEDSQSLENSPQASKDRQEVKRSP